MPQGRVRTVRKEAKKKKNNPKRSLGSARSNAWNFETCAGANPKVLKCSMPSASTSPKRSTTFEVKVGLIYVLPILLALWGFVQNDLPCTRDPRAGRPRSGAHGLLLELLGPAQRARNLKQMYIDEQKQMQQWTRGYFSSSVQQVALDRSWRGAPLQSCEVFTQDIGRDALPTWRLRLRHSQTLECWVWGRFHPQSTWAIPENARARIHAIALTVVLNSTAPGVRSRIYFHNQDPLSISDPLTCNKRTLWHHSFGFVLLTHVWLYKRETVSAEHTDEQRLHVRSAAHLALFC